MTIGMAAPVLTGRKTLVRGSASVSEDRAAGTIEIKTTVELLTVTPAEPDVDDAATGEPADGETVDPDGVGAVDVGTGKEPAPDVETVAADAVATVVIAAPQPRL